MELELEGREEEGGKRGDKKEYLIILLER